MTFGFSPPMQQRPMMQPGAVQFPQMQTASNVAPNLAGLKPISFGDIRSGLQKIGIGGPPPGQAAANQAGYSDAVRNTTSPVGYTPPADTGQMNWGASMGPSMVGAGAGSDALGAAAPAAADAAGAAGGATAAAGGADIGKFLMAFLGL